MQKPTIWWIIGITNNIPFGKHTKNYGKSQLLMGKYTISMAIFNSYVSLPEGDRGLSRMGHQHVAIKHVETKVWTNYWTRHVVLLRHPFHGDSYPHSALDLAISHLPFGSYYNRHSQKKSSYSRQSPPKSASSRSAGNKQTEPTKPPPPASLPFCKMGRRHLKCLHIPPGLKLHGKDTGLGSFLLCLKPNMRI